MLLIALPLWRRLPVLLPATHGLRYLPLLASMLTLLRKEKVLRVRGTLALLMFAAFNIFWSVLVLAWWPLSMMENSLPALGFWWVTDKAAAA